MTAKAGKATGRKAMGDTKGHKAKVCTMGHMAMDDTTGRKAKVCTMGHTISSKD